MLLAQSLCAARRLAVTDCALPQDLETECLKHGSMALQEIGLSMLKHISSHRGLTYVPRTIDFRQLKTHFLQA